MNENDLVTYKDFDQFSFGKYYSYDHDDFGNHFDISSSCPVSTCDLSAISNILMIMMLNNIQVYLNQKLYFNN